MSDYSFLFLVGASGSGTTMLTRLLSSPAECVSLGGNHISIPRSDRQAYGLARRFKTANDSLWDRRASAADSEAGGREMISLINQLRQLDNYAGVKSIVFKRSAPFHRGDRYRPDLLDVVDLFPRSKVVAVYRDPSASSASSFRRRFARTLRACAVITAEQLTYLAAQLEQLPAEQRLVLSYESLCRQPEEHILSLADFAQIPAAGLDHAIAEEGLDPGRNRAWRKRLPDKEVAFLEHYFDDRRRAQWSILDRLTPRDWR